MSPINVSAASSSIDVTAGESTVEIEVSAGQVDVDVLGGQGPQGPAGPQGPPGQGGASSWNDLEDKPPSFPPEAHTHALSSLTQSSATPGQVVTWSGSAWTAADVDGGAAGAVASLLLHFDGSLSDSSGNGIEITAEGDADTSASESKFGGGSLHFPAAGDHLVAEASAGFAFGTGDFTIDFWCWVPSGGIGGVTPYTADGTVDWGTWVYKDGGQWKLIFDIPGVTDVSRNVTITDETWHHVAFSRQGGLLRFFLDGVQAGSSASLANDLGQTSGAIVVGYPTGSGFAGYLDELRIAKGAALFTENFTPPASPYASGSASSAGTTIRQRRGTAAGLASVTLGSGQLAYETDTGKVKIGDGETIYGSLAYVGGSSAWADITGKPSTFAPSAHKTSHATGGSDALTATDIGAAAASHAHAWSDIASGVPSTFPPSSHSHGNLSNDGLVNGNTASGQIVVTTTGGALTTSATISSSAVSGLGGAATLNVGTTAGTVAAGDHTHAQLHDRSHAITSSSDHTATAWRVWYSNASGVVTELALGASGTVLTSGGASAAPTFSVLPAGGTKTVIRFTPADNQPPSSNFATLDTRNSFLVLEFDASTQENASFVGVIPEGATLTNGLTVRLWWMGDTATSGNVRWGVSFERTGTDNDSDSFSSVTEANGAASGTSGIETVTEITATAIDSLVAGDRFRLRVARIAADAVNDTMLGDAQLVAVEVRVA